MDNKNTSNRKCHRNIDFPVSVIGTKRKERPDNEMTLEEVVKRMKRKTLEHEKQADKERIQNLENKVSELSEVSRKRVSRIPSNSKKSFHNTNYAAVVNILSWWTQYQSCQ